MGGSTGTAWTFGVVTVEMKLMFLVLPIFFSVLSTVCCISPGKPLLKFDEKNRKFAVSDDALREIQTLKGPVKIVGTIGDARVGKSTNLNFIGYFLEENQRVEKVFKTSDGMKPCTTGVWMSVLRDSNGDGSTILLDTEGTNLGSNENTDLLSIFTVLMSSGLALFAREGVQNHNVQFLYRISRLSEEIWKQDAESLTTFPQLLVILRDALAPSTGKTIQSQTQDFILYGNYGNTIARHFPRDNIKVKDIPLVRDSKRLRDLEQFPRDDYADIAFSLAAEFKRFPPKQTVKGANMDGRMIADLARNLEAAVNQNSLSGFSNAYKAFETQICDRSYREIVEPFLRNSLDHIKNSKQTFIDKFAEKCALETERAKTRDMIDKTIAQEEEIVEQQRRLDKERRRKEEEESLERERKEQRRQEAQEKERKLKEEQKARQRAEEEERVQKENLRRAEEQRKRLEAEAAARRSRERERRDIGRAVVGGALLFAVFSDSRLKENITTVPHSEFEHIGLHGYNWVWSKDAIELGKSGEGSGVIAQEVEKLYPWTVVTGHDGYKRVNYAALKQLLVEKRIGD